MFSFNDHLDPTGEIQSSSGLGVDLPSTTWTASPWDEDFSNLDDPLSGRIRNASFFDGVRNEDDEFVGDAEHEEISPFGSDFLSTHPRQQRKRERNEDQSMQGSFDRISPLSHLGHPLSGLTPSTQELAASAKLQRKEALRTLQDQVAKLVSTQYLKELNVFSAPMSWPEEEDNEAREAAARAFLNWRVKDVRDRSAWRWVVDDALELKQPDPSLVRPLLTTNGLKPQTSCHGNAAREPQRTESLMRLTGLEAVVADTASISGMLDMINRNALARHDAASGGAAASRPCDRSTDNNDDGGSGPSPSTASSNTGEGQQQNDHVGSTAAEALGSNTNNAATSSSSSIASSDPRLQQEQLQSPSSFALPPPVRLTCDVACSDMVVDGPRLRCHWVLRTVGLSSFRGCGDREVAVDGMLSCVFAAAAPPDPSGSGGSVGGGEVAGNGGGGGGVSSGGSHLNGAAPPSRSRFEPPWTRASAAAVGAGTGEHHKIASAELHYDVLSLARQLHAAGVLDPSLMAAHAASAASPPGISPMNELPVMAQLLRIGGGDSAGGSGRGSGGVASPPQREEVVEGGSPEECPEGRLDQRLTGSKEGAGPAARSAGSEGSRNENKDRHDDDQNDEDMTASAAASLKLPSLSSLLPPDQYPPLSELVARATAEASVLVAAEPSGSSSSSGSTATTTTSSTSTSSSSALGSRGKRSVNVQQPISGRPPSAGSTAAGATPAAAGTAGGVTAHGILAFGGGAANGSSTQQQQKAPPPQHDPFAAPSPRAAPLPSPSSSSLGAHPPPPHHPGFLMQPHMLGLAPGGPALAGGLPLPPGAFPPFLPQHLPAPSPLPPSLSGLSQPSPSSSSSLPSQLSLSSLPSSLPASLPAPLPTSLPAPPPPTSSINSTPTATTTAINNNSSSSSSSSSSNGSDGGGGMLSVSELQQVMAENGGIIPSDVLSSMFDSISRGGAAAYSTSKPHAQAAPLPSIPGLPQALAALAALAKTAPASLSMPPAPPPSSVPPK